MSQIPLIDDGHVAALERDREYEVDRTPGPVVRQGLNWGAEQFQRYMGRNPTCIIDIGAGSGVFGQQALHVWGPSPVRIGVEIRPEESDAARHYDRFVIGDALHPAVLFDLFPEELAGGPPSRDAEPWVDLVVANPKFSIWAPLLRTYIQRSRFVLFYGTIAWGCAEGTRDEETGEGLTGAELFRDLTPIECARVSGRVAHRGPGLNPKTGEPWGADQRDVCWWLWRRRDHPKKWMTSNLPALSGAERRWTIKPGAER